MDYDNSDPLFHHYIIPRGLGVSLKGNTSMKNLYGENINTDLFKLKGKNKTKKSITRSSRYSRKQYTK